MTTETTHPTAHRYRPHRVDGRAQRATTRGALRAARASLPALDVGDGAWLDRLALDAPGPLAPNAAETWAASLPSASDLAIHAERVARTRRSARAVALETKCAPFFEDEADVEVEQAEHASELRWPWAFASLAFLVVLIAACARYAL
jgi:hypothetical protein